MPVTRDGHSPPPCQLALDGGELADPLRWLRRRQRPPNPAQLVSRPASGTLDAKGALCKRLARVDVARDQDSRDAGCGGAGGGAVPAAPPSDGSCYSFAALAQPCS